MSSDEKDNPINDKPFEKEQINGLDNIKHLEESLSAIDSPNSSVPVLNEVEWKKLQHYIAAPSNGVELINNNNSVQYKNLEDYHVVPVDHLHHLICGVVTHKTTHPDICTFLQDIIKDVNISQHNINTLTQGPLFDKNGVSVQVILPIDIQTFLQGALSKENKQLQLQLQQKYNITIKIINTQLPPDNDNHTVNINVEDVTDIQALLALVVVLKCFPEGWWNEFFWDAWLAVTIQLNLLKKNNEPFPCQWLKDVFLAEKLVERPEKVHCLLMGQDPVSKGDPSNLRKATGVAFHKIGDTNPSISGMNTNYGLDCRGEKPIQHCKNGILLVNMVRCIPKGKNSMNNNPFCDAWFVYSLKLAKYFGENNKPVVVMCNRSYLPYLMTCILQIDPFAERVQHPAYPVNQIDEDTFCGLVLTNPDLPEFWNTLQYYINDKSITMEHKLYDRTVASIYVSAEDKSKYTVTVPVNALHNILVTAVKCDLSHSNADFLRKLSYNTKIVPPQPNLTKYSISDTITVTVSEPLIQLLTNVADKKPYTPMGGGTIEIYDSTRDPSNPIFTHKVTDLQTLLALAVTIQFYILGWKEFFWDAWLAVTIQLGLLEKVNYDTANKEIFPCMWIKRVFYVERLVDRPENMRVVLLGEEPFTNTDAKILIQLRNATAIANIGDNKRGIAVTCQTDFKEKVSRTDHCKAGLLLANMIRCNHRDGQSMDNNDCYYAWLCYTLKLVKYCGEHHIPVVLCSSSVDNNFEQYIRTVNNNIHVLLPQQLATIPISVTVNNPEPITITRIQNEVTVTFTTPN